MQSYLVFDVVGLWPSHGLVSQYFTDTKTESSQVGGIYHRSNSRSVFYWRIGTRVDLELFNPIRKLLILVFCGVVALFNFFLARGFCFWGIARPF